MSMIIRKESTGNFFHYFTINGKEYEYAASDITFIAENNRAKFRSITGREIALRDGYLVSEISVFDVSTGGSEEQFVSFVSLIARLIALGYPAFVVQGQVITTSEWGDITGNILAQADLITYISNNAGSGVQSVTGDSVDNTDPLNPIVNAIPLTGTEVGSPVTGNIELNEDVEIILSNIFGDVQSIVGRSDGKIEIKSDAFSVLISADAGLQVDNGIETNGIKGLGGGELEIAGSDAGRGLFSLSYYGANYTDNTYVQKKYVDDTKNLTTGYTVATLPTGTTGQIAHVTDATTVTYRGTATGGGSDVALVMFDGANWIYH